MTTFDILDSGNRREFPTGAVRDIDETKPRPDLISPFALLRVGAWMLMGMRKYGERNWERGMQISVFLASLMRHLLYYLAGKRDEDHMAAVIFNAQAILHFEELALQGDATALSLLDAGAALTLKREVEARGLEQTART